MNRLFRAGILSLLATAALTGMKAEGPRTKKSPAASPEEAVKALGLALRAGDPQAVQNQLAEPECSTLQLALATSLNQERFAKALNDKFGDDPDAKPRPPAMELLLEKFLVGHLAEAAFEGTGPELMQTRDTIDLAVRQKEEQDKNRVALTVWVAWGKPRKTIAEHRWNAVRKGQAWKLLTHTFGEASAKKANRTTAGGKEVEVAVVSPGGFQPTARMVAYAQEVLPRSQALVDRFCKEVREGKYASRGDALKAWGKMVVDFAKAHPQPRTEPRIKSSPKE